MNIIKQKQFNRYTELTCGDQRGEERRKIHDRGRELKGTNYYV